VLTPLPGTHTAPVYVRRLSGDSVTAAFILTGSFGIWHTFVVGGPDAF